MEIARPTFGGLASGLDTNALLEGLLQIERLPLQRLQSRRAEINSQRTLMRDLNSKLLELREASQALDNRNDTGSAASLDEEFLRYTGASSNEDVVEVSASSGAAPGDIDIEVIRLARGSRRFSTAYSSVDDTALSANQSITIRLPNGDPDDDEVNDTEITIAAGASDDISLSSLRDRINTDPENGGTVRADILQVSEDEFQLILTTTGTGVSNQLEIEGDVAFESPADDGSDNASNAQIRLFGQTGEGRVIQRESNTIDDVLEGVSFRLKREADLVDEDGTGALGDPRVAETVTVDTDLDEIASGLQRFIDAYNDVVNFIDRQFRYDETNKTAGPLSGDSTLRRVQTELRTLISRGYAFGENPNNPFAAGEVGGSIANIGIEVVSGGTLRLDREKLDEALALDPLSVRQFLMGDERLTPANQDEIDADPEVEPDYYDEGFAQLFAVRLEELVRSGDGTFAERDKAFADRLADFDRSIENFEFRLGQREETLIQRFSALERIVAGLQSQQGFLTSLG